MILYTVALDVRPVPALIEQRIMTVNTTKNRLDSQVTPIDMDNGAFIWLLPDILGPGAWSLFQTLCQQLPWQQPQVRVFGRRHSVPRLTCWIADQGVGYHYSGISHLGIGWPAVMAPLRQRLTVLTGRHPNGALANLYRHGDDSMGWHRDNEPELGRDPWILSYNLGAERDFAFRQYGTSRQSHLITLQHDSLLVMSPQVQTHFEHALPRRRRVRDRRLNLTFREIINRHNSPDG